MEPDVVVVAGAGVAGLACASDLVAAGLRVVLAEAGDRPGGRMRTDRRDGFVLDRGFQVLNPFYPQVKKRIVPDALDLHEFYPGFLLHGPKGRRRIGNPVQERQVLKELRHGLPGSPRDLAALAALSARDVYLPPERIKDAPDESAYASLRGAGLSAGFIDRVLRPFFAGVFLEPDLETSSRMLHLVWRSMLRGRATLPSTGVGAVPSLLAGRLPSGCLRLETPVSAISDEGVVLAGVEEIAAAAVVVATGPRAAEELISHPEDDLAGQTPPVPMRAVTTYYHAADRSPLAEPAIIVDEAMRILNTAVLTEVCSAYSSDGRALISTSVLGTPEDHRDLPLLAVLGELYQADTGSWEPLATYDIPEALPVMTPPWPLTRSTRVRAGRYVCGDYRATGSVQGAMASGARAAREVIADLRDGRGRS